MSKKQLSSKRAKLIISNESTNQHIKKKSRVNFLKNNWGPIALNYFCLKDQQKSGPTKLWGL